MEKKNDNLLTWEERVTTYLNVLETEKDEIERGVAMEYLKEMATIADNEKNLKEIIQMYINYGKTSDKEIKGYLENTSLLMKCHKGENTMFGYYFIENEFLNKIKKKPRETSINFDAVPGLYAGDLDWKEYKKMIFLVKSTSRFFLRADIGEVFDQINHRDVDKIKGICVNRDSSHLIEGSQGEHFLMEATLFI